MTELRNCADCGVKPGEPHDDGCDVARCTVCGWQRISCEHEEQDVGWGQTWTGEFPGHAECREFGWFTPDGWPDLNKLDDAARWGTLVWSTEADRWVKP